LGGNPIRKRIAIDAMGGDYAPQETVKGALEAAKIDSNLEPILVGPLNILRKEFEKHDISISNIHLVHADNFITEGENPALVVRRKPNSSIAIACRMVKSGEAHAVLGATATGSMVTTAIQYLGMLEGISRPVLGGVLSLIAPTTVVLDLGVSMDCKPRQLIEFAIIGTVYARALLGVHEPKVALLNVGKESTKGNNLARETYPLLERSGLNFIGNVEGNQILSGEANVIVCDGFVGNHIFKFSESIGEIFDNHIMNKLSENKRVQQSVRNNLQALVGLLALPDVIGGGILWGINGIVARMHGNSRAPMVAKRLAQTKIAVERDIVADLKIELSKVRNNVNLDF
jgi:glycerol-3-phosphate acyltransferase PlsX